jgi:peptidase E
MGKNTKAFEFHSEKIQDIISTNATLIPNNFNLDDHDSIINDESIDERSFSIIYVAGGNTYKMLNLGIILLFCNIIQSRYIDYHLTVARSKQECQDWVTGHL